jgi:hypothetical protein
MADTYSKVGPPPTDGMTRRQRTEYWIARFQVAIEDAEKVLQAALEVRACPLLPRAHLEALQSQQSSLFDELREIDNDA